MRLSATQGDQQENQSTMRCWILSLKVVRDVKVASLRVFCKVFQLSAAAKQKELRPKVVEALMEG